LKVSKIFLYDEPAVQEIQISNLKNFLLKTFHVDVEIKGCIFNNLDVKDVEKISGCRIFKPKVPFKKYLPNKQEIDFEKTVCKDTKLMEKTTMEPVTLSAPSSAVWCCAEAVCIQVLKPD